MTIRRTARDTTESWLSRELRERIARIGAGIERQVQAESSEAEAHRQIEREAGQ